MHKLLSLVAALAALSYTTSSYAYQQCANEASMFTPNTTMGSISSSINFNNSSTKTIKIYWLNFSGQRVLYKTMAPKTSYKQKTYLTAPWVVTDVNDNCKGIYLPDGQPRTVKFTK